MSDEHHEPNQRLERLLRRWGAERAAEEAEIPPLRTPLTGPADSARPAARPVAMPPRWLLRAAALILVVGATAFITMATQELWGPAPPGPEQESSGAAPAGPDDVRLARREEPDAEPRFRAMLHPPEGDHKKTEVPVPMPPPPSLEDQLRKARAALLEREAQLAEAKVILVRAHRAIADLRAMESSPRVAQLGRKLAAAETARAEAEKRLAAAKARTDAMRLALRRCYLPPVMCDPAGGIVSGRAAVRKHRLLERCAEVRGQVRSPESRRLFDKLEVVLTRLDILAPDDAAGVRSFTSLLPRLNLTGQIDKALSTAHEQPAVRMWLAETRLVLTEVKGGL